MNRAPSPKRLPFAILMELAPLGIAAIATGLWYAGDALNRLGGSFDTAVLLALTGIFLLELLLSMAFLVSGFGWLVIDRTLPGLMVLISRLFFVLFLYSKALDRWFNPDGCNGTCPGLDMSFYVALIATLAIPIASALGLWLSATGQIGQRQRV
jgi:hypothetical protein